EKPLSVIYVCASEKAKKTVYKSVKLGFADNDTSTNRTVIDSAYGMLCAKKIPDHESNKAFKDCDIIQQFINGSYSFYTKQLLEQNGKLIDKDIYQALKTELDSEIAEKAENTEKKKTYYINQEEAQNAASNADADYIEGMKALINKLHHNAAPALKYTDSKTQIDNIFWGFNSCLLKTCPPEALLHNNVIGNAETQSDAAYPKNEFCCYRSVYGVDVDHFPKFAETDDGIYYKNYCELLSSIDNTLLLTPHLDKTWHITLPYLSEAKQREEDKRLCKSILYAFAYNRLRIDGGVYQILRDKDSSYVTLRDGSDEIRKSEFSDLIAFLMKDDTFINHDVKLLEERYRKDTLNLNDYVSTKIYQYLNTSEEKNPLKLIVTYSNCKTCDREIKNGLIGAIEEILMDLINAYDETHYDMNRSEDSKTKVQTDRLREIYNACDCKGKENVFVSWLNRFDY
ncbi:MAG: hypothetical protein IKD07_05845, partial [Clostridia bacterium]|nr:hypothetical protein [Clostridia bacterium]